MSLVGKRLQGRKIVIFHTKYPNIFRASLRSVQFFKVRLLPNLKSWIRPWIGYLDILVDSPCLDAQQKIATVGSIE